MKKVGLKILLFFILVFISLELFYETTPPIFSFRMFYTHLKKMVIRDDDHYNPYSEKVTSRINNIGYDSHIDFYVDSLKSNDYAVIGDSFIASKQCGTFNSISYFLDENIKHAKVYNFGIVEGNINDYYVVYSKYHLEKLKKVFILLTGTSDLTYSEGFVEKKEKPKNFKLKTIQLIYRKLNQNKKYSTPNYGLINNDLKNVVLLVHEGLNKNLLREHGIKLDIIELSIEDDFRYSDGHYNKEGNKKIARLIKDYVDKIQK